MFIQNILELQGGYAATVAADAPVIDALEIMRFENADALLVDPGDVRTNGIFTEGDVVRALCDVGRAIFDLAVCELMTRPGITCRSSDTVASVMMLMWRNGIRHVPVADGGRLIGLIGYGDILNQRYRFLTAEDGEGAVPRRNARPVALMHR